MLRFNGDRWVYVPHPALIRADDATTFREEDHPRDQGGRFTAGGGSSVLGTKLKATARHFAHEDYQILRKHLDARHPDEQKNLTKHLKTAAKALPDLIKHHFDEEKQTVIDAAGALKALASGSKPTPEQFKGLRSFGTRTLMVCASTALGDPTGAIGHLASALTHEVVQHVIIEHALKLFAGTAMATVKRGDSEDDGMDLLRQFVECIGRAIEDLDNVFDARADDAEWNEADHPREEDGKFTEGSGSSSKSHLQPTHLVEGKRVTASGGQLPSHIATLKIPPAWTDVAYAEDPKSALLVTGRDAKGRPTSIYSAEHSARQAAVKFARVHELNAKLESIKAQNEQAMKAAETRDVAHCLDLIMATGIRPGGEGDTGAAVQAYGATTLEGRHVRVTPNGHVSLQFVGKKGVALNIPIDDPALAKRLVARKQKAGGGGRLFGDVTAASLLAHVHSLDGGGFKTKDFRTFLGTSTAAKLVTDQPAPTNEKAYRKAVMAVAKAVSQKLGNTPTIALQSYINPAVFAPWRIAA